MRNEIRIGKWLGAVCLVLILNVAQAAPLDKLVGDSEWNGQYGYSDGRASVGFTMTLRVAADGSFSGRTTEPNTFGDKSASHLYGNLRGSISGNAIQFVKTMDGTGGVSHSINYSGTLNADGTSISGNWRIKSSGPFSASLTRAPARKHTGCIVPAETLRTTEGFVYWDFRNTCDAYKLVSVCARFGNGDNNILAVNIPAKNSDAINLGMSSRGPAQLSWKEGGGLPCP
jgi:hypothetical protein